jgi:hypothetical protein
VPDSQSDRGRALTGSPVDFPTCCVELVLFGDFDVAVYVITVGVFSARYCCACWRTAERVSTRSIMVNKVAAYADGCLAFEWGLRMDSLTSLVEASIV